MPGVDDAKLTEGLMRDLSEAQALSAQVAMGTGAPAPEDFAPRAMRIKNKIIGEKELAASKRAINKVADELVFEAGMLDNEQRSVFASKMKTRLNQYRMMLMQNAAVMQKEMQKRGLDQKQAQAVWAAVGNAVGALSSQLVERHDSQFLDRMAGIKDIEGAE